MPKVEHAGYHIEVTPYVEEAVARLGIFRREAVPYLAEGVARYFNAGKIRYEMRRAGEELTDDEKEAAGLARRIRMSRDFWNALTDEGRADPVKAPEILFQRVTSNLYREGKRRQLDASYAGSRGDGMSSFWDEVTLEIVAPNCCNAAQKMANKWMPTPDRPRLPLPDCDRDVCHCYYDTSKARRKRRQERPVEQTEASLVRPAIAQLEPKAKPAPERRVGFWERLFGR